MPVRARTFASSTPVKAAHGTAKIRSLANERPQLNGRLALAVSCFGSPQGPHARQLFRSDADVERRCEVNCAALFRAVCEPPVEVVQHGLSLLFAQVGDEHAGNRVPRDAPIPQLLTRPQLEALL